MEMQNTDGYLSSNGFQALLEASQELICVTDRSGQIQFSNTAFLKRLGYRSEQIRSLNIRQLVHLQDQLTVQSHLENFSSSTEDFENRFLSAKGEYCWLLWTVTACPPSPFLYWFARDIGQRKKQEAEVAFSDQLLKHTIHSLPFLVAYLDLNFKYRFMNKSYERWLGDMAEVARNGDMEKAVGPEFAAQLDLHRRLAVKTHQPNRFEGSFQNVHGEKRFLDVQYHPHLNEKGELLGLMAIAYDITERKRDHQALLETEQKFQRVLSDGKIGFYEVNFKKGSISISENIRESIGMPDATVLTEDIFEKMLHPEDRTKVMSYRDPHAPWTAEIEFRVKSTGGKYVWIFATRHQIFDENHNLTGVMGITVDTTERREMEETLQSQRAKMMASSRLSAIGEMASGVAHEINNPLAIIFSSAEALKLSTDRGKLNHELIDRSVHRIESTVMRISKIIHSLRALSRDSESDPFEPVAIRKIVDDALEICKQRLTSHQISLQVDLPADDVYLYARPTQISQVLLNLLNNAHDAVEQLENRWIRVAAKDKGTHIEISVSDSGPGIPESLRSKIFDPFFTTKDPTKGTGLGLSVSNNIILSHGGSLEINKESPTTEFIIRLPKNLRHYGSEKNEA